jgi:hypothetical protein
MKRILLVPASLVLAAGVSAVGCARTQAKAIVEPPRLNVPLPPPRVVETVVVPNLREPSSLPRPTSVLSNLRGRGMKSRSRRLCKLYLHSRRERSRPSCEGC